VEKDAALCVSVGGQTCEWWRKGVFVHRVVKLSEMRIAVGMFDDSIFEPMRVLDGFKPPAKIFG
jgi:hypothetical protein